MQDSRKTGKGVILCVEEVVGRWITAVAAAALAAGQQSRGGMARY